MRIGSVYAAHERALSVLSGVVARIRRYLANNDATAFFSATGDLVLTGPTLTNVNDVRVILVD